MKEFLEALRRRPVVPAVRGPEGLLERALAGDHAAIFALGGDVFQTLELLSGTRRRPLVCVNVDTVGGIAADQSGVKFLAGRVEGVISTHRHIVELARGAGLITIQRLFAIDSGAVERGLKLIRRAAPDCVEILPGLAYPEIADEYHRALSQPALAGGLIRDPETVRAILAAGATAVSTSDPSLWEALDSERGVM
ncbi:transcriptional regulator [Rubrobacter xylanophilus]|uniref:Transcriptional regulator n=1 Tax=Rubrobacter xylanophilus TaxID=49319 RepID=A0A510HF03_9ACTN|nr:glycerol-3-phosphate responsive antiterminator [Rubrobacter xylanophilus]BBL78516.1 transcriptional regulator [Rubrobacter xylanophilus]